LESHVYTAYRETCLDIATRLDAASSPATDQPHYVSRTGLMKGVYRYRGEQHIEAFMRTKGARVSHPEAMSRRDQLSAYASHRRVFGVIGSAMHNVVFAPGPTAASYFAPSWVNPTCFLIDRVAGVDSAYVRATGMLDNLQAVRDRIGKLLPGLAKR